MMTASYARGSVSARWRVVVCALFAVVVLMRIYVLALPLFFGGWDATVDFGARPGHDLSLIHL